jgi:hypothetical protein
MAMDSSVTHTSMSSPDVEPLKFVPPEPILLIDHTADKPGLWAKNVVIPEYEVIQGKSKTGGYVVYVVRIDTLTGGQIRICRRYSEFDELRAQLVKAFPSKLGEIPELPPKSVVAKFRDSFLQERRKRLEYFLLCVLLNPEFMQCDIVKRWIGKEHTIN